MNMDVILPNRHNSSLARLAPPKAPSYSTAAKNEAHYFEGVENRARNAKGLRSGRFSEAGYNKTE
jgi:hypothetical protein